MRFKDLGLLFALGAMWGSSFLFIKLALSEMDPSVIVAGRFFFAVLSLLAALPLLNRVSGADGGILRDAARLWRPLIFLGVVNAAFPYLAISWGTQFLPSGTAAILNSTVPLFTALLAASLPFYADERLDALGVAGILLGAAGVGVLAGGFGDLSAGYAPALAGALGVLAGSLAYAVGGLFARRAMKGVPVSVSAVGQNVAGLLATLPLALFALPGSVPSATAVGAVVWLGLIGTGFSLLLYYRLIANVGATRTSTVTYLVPVWALLYGALFLDEGITARSLLGLALILAGVAGVSGIRRPGKPPEATP